jgi:hypothetical protein
MVRPGNDSCAATGPNEPAMADDKQLIVGIDIGKNSFPVVGRTERVAGIRK